ncbi:MAG: helicase-related protein, partial [Angelakisella sp.]
DEYNLARASTLNAHYTSPTVITAMYHTLHRMGFRQGKILEPAVGVGYFFGLLPEEMQDCTLHGVELDSVTGRIAQILYPQAKIQIRGFQDTKYADGEFDVLVGNVPFGDYNISDDRYSMHIHDYFFVRGLDKLRTGGIMAFITSKGTLDKLGNEVRRMIAQRADLLGAIRLPNTAFKEIAGTEVTTDIIFLQKRAQPPEEYPDWVFVEEYPDNPEIIINSYFAANPQMLLGTMVPRSGMYGGKDTALVPAPDWEKKLWEAVDSIGGQYLDSPKMPTNAPKNALVDLPYDDTVARFTYCVRGAYLYYNDGVMLRHQSFDSKKTSRIQHMDTIRTAVREVIAVQCEEHFQDALLKAAQDRLGVLYDRFVKEYGYINARANQLAFSEDIDIALISSLETPNEDGSYSKTEFFSEATIKQTTPITFADNAVDALLISLNQRGNVDMEYMQSLTGFTKEKILTDLEDRVYIDHRSNAEMPRYLSSDEYLSGDVRTALSEVKTLVPDRTELRRNLVALEQVQPDWIPAVDIGVRLSSHWVGQETITQFIHELLDTPRYQRNPDFNGCIVANYSRTSNEWNISNKSQHNSVITNSKYGTTRIGAYAIIESTLNQREITIRDPYEEEGKTKYQYNHEETVLARQKQELIQECFRDWIFADTDRRNRLEHIYNYTFNRIQPRVFDGSYITLPETNPLIRLRPHQLNGIARIRTGSNVLLGHVVGAGKTFTMVAGGMELLRLGVSHKLLYVVPNHIIGDFASDFLRLYPNARILVPGERDFQKGNRHRFVAKIATANIEAIIIGHSQFEKLDITPERKAKEIDKEIDSLTHAIENAESSDAPRYTIKQLEKSKQALTDRMKALLTSKDKDTMLYFEQLGVDGLFIDEAHNYKNGALHSKMSNIAGVPSGSSLKSADLLAKLRYIGEIDGSVVFATGTFISNSICEMYIMQRYLQEPTLHAKDICHFDEWASIFGETVTSLEVKPEGGGYRTNTRFSQFYNLPELMSMFGEVADIQTAEMLNLPRPVLVGGKPVVIDCAPSPELQEFMDNCVIRAKNIRSGAVKSFEDNMLKLTNEARKAGTDMRLLSEENCFDPNGKLAMCAQQIAQNLRNSDAIKGTVLVFSDIGTPSSSFNVYDELRRLLILNGVDAADIAYIHEAKNDKAKKRLFEEMRSGAKRVLIGSTAKCGAGTNIQDRMVALHHLDCPWRPSDIEQREGRILRQGNMNKEVYIYRYVTRRSFDSYLWQLVEQKQRFISQIMNGKNAGRSCKDIDETVLSFAEVKAIASGDPRIKESMELQMDIEKLIVLKNQYTKEQYRLQDLIKTTYPKKKNQLLLDMEEVGADLDAKSAYSDEFAIEIGGASYSERTKAGDALQDKLLGCKPKFGEELEVGSYRGLQLLFCATFGGNVLRLRGRHSYSIEMGDSPLGNIRKIENRIDSAKELLQSLTEQLEKLETDMTNAQQQLSLPFSKAHELSEKQQQLIALTAEINVATGQVAENVSEATMSQ